VSNSAAGDAYWRAAGALARYVVPNAIPLPDIADAASNAASNAAPNAASRATSAAAPVVLFAGRMDEAKNVDTLIEALGLLAPDLAFSAVLCGDGPWRAALAARVSLLGLARTVAFPGYVGDLWARMKRADVLVSLSRIEGCPNVVLEAMACGCPLVVSDIAAHRAVLDATCAWLVPPDDPAAAASAIRAALAPGGIGTVRARAARARVARWAGHAAAERYEAIYRTVLGA
jgi:glycosyltransferase involved in cell wall biosynthesis